MSTSIVIPQYLRRPEPEEQPAQPDYTAMQQEAERHNEEYTKALNDWNKLYSDTVAEKANLYKADPKLAEAKRKEAALKTLVGAFGSLADTFAVARGGTAPLRDHRADIYRTQQQGDALDQSERAREAAAYQKWLEQLEKIADKRPKWTKNDAAIQLSKMYADDDRANIRMLFEMEKQKDQQEFIEKENAKYKEKPKPKPKPEPKEPTPYSSIFIDLGDGNGKKSIPLDKGQFAALAAIVAKEKGLNFGSKEVADDNHDMQLLRYSMGEGGVNKLAWEQLLAKYPDLIRDAVREMVYGAPAATTPQNTNTTTGTAKAPTF
jgi:hypothetical protein